MFYSHYVIYFLISCRLFCCCLFFFLMIRRPPRSTLSSSSAASDVYKRQGFKRRVGDVGAEVPTQSYDGTVPIHPSIAPPTCPAHPTTPPQPCLLYTSPSPRDS
eukprot:TRINITY_DN20844_c0_g1_i3.p1 TRINITY_DN20844_c0_g1~~TRINITY_DN20844_c0_g1_i3.p1  ORF type:complete len:104 (+),score=13.67 TRINITY_DN20844_c0_g1_i3:21-332(+)